MKKDSGKRKLICIITAIAVMALIISGVLYFRSISLTADEQMQETADSEIIKEKDSKTESLVSAKEETVVDSSAEAEPVDDETVDEDSPSSGDNGLTVSALERKGHYETVQVLVSEAWDEKVLAKKGACEDILVSEAWDEEVGSCYAFGRDYEMGYECGICGFQTTGDIASHIKSEHDGAGNWHNVKIYTSEEKCLDYRTEIIHHDAVYKKVCEEDEYTIVHHDAVYRSERVWVDD